MADIPMIELVKLTNSLDTAIINYKKIIAAEIMNHDDKRVVVCSLNRFSKFRETIGDIIDKYKN